MSQETTQTILALRVLGVELELSVSDRELREQLEELWTDCRHGPDLHAGSAWVRVEGQGPYAVVTPSGRSVCRTASHALATTLAAINSAAIGATPYLTVHCAVVARDGRALALPAPSGRGKTTTTVALMQRGWTYVSDEALALQWDDGAVMTYPRPLAMSAWAAQALDVRQGQDADGEIVVTPAQLGTRAVGRGEPLVLDAVVLLERDGTDPVAGRVLPVDRAEVLTALLRRCFNHYVDPSRTLDVLGEVVRTTRVATLRLGAPAASAETLERWLDG